MYRVARKGTRARLGTHKGKRVGAKIGFECVAPEHRGKIADDQPDKLTIVNGEWAYCPRSARAEGHEWKTTGGEEYASVMRRTSHSVVHAVSGARAG